MAVRWEHGGEDSVCLFMIGSEASILWNENKLIRELLGMVRSIVST